MERNIEFESKLFGKTIKIYVYDAPAQIVSDLYPQIYEKAKYLQLIFNFFDDKSELSQLNKKRNIVASSELLTVISQAINYCKLSNGNYDISLGKQILARKQKKELPVVSCTYKDIVINNNEISLTHPDVLIDLSSIAKGFIVDKLSDYMREIGLESFFIDARGDMLAVGSHTEEVTIQHPREPKKTLHNFTLQNSAVATSGDYLQYDKDFSKSHILGKTDLISVTVIAPTAMQADGLASVFFLSPLHLRKEIAAQNSHCKILTIDGNLQELSFNDFIRRI